jgi:hypothetical protein
MNYITKDLLLDLCSAASEPCRLASIYIPMDRFDFGINQTRFKNVMKSLKGRIADFETYKHFGTMQSLQDDPVFWANQKNGISFFLSPRDLIQVSLPFVPPEFHEVADRFYTAPLILYRHAEEPFYVVAVSPKKVRVFDANLFDIQEHEIPGLDQGLWDRLQIDELNDSQQYHTSGREGLGGSTQQVMRHGHGSGSEKIRTTLFAKYMRSVCQEIRPYLTDRQRRIIFAGVGSHYPVFLEVGGFPNRILPEFIEGSFDNVRPSDLLPKVQSLIRNIMTEEVRAINAAADDRRGTSLFEIRDPQIVEAAKYGQIDALIVNVERFLRDFRAPSPEFWTYEAAIRETFLHGGRVVPTFDTRSLAMKAMKRFSAEGASIQA